jgi:phenylacetate-CoA ligase
VGAANRLDVGSIGIRRLILAGEPGGSVPAVRSRIESLWQAKVLDHCGATEVGPWGFGDLTGDFVRVIESEFIAEFLSIATGTAAAEGELAELVITTLGRAGSPVIRYRTGDLVRPTWRSEKKMSGTVSLKPESVPDTFFENRFVRLEGGVLGRTDDMLIVRGVNVFPSSIEQIVRSFPEVVEFRAIIDKESQLDRITIEIEDRLEQPERVAQELQLRLGLSVDVRTASLGSLPRYEGKGKRFVDRRQKSGE